MKNLLKSAGSTVLLGSLALAPLASGQNPNADRYIVQVRAGNQPGDVAATHGVAARHVYTHVVNGFAGQIPPGRLAVLANDPRVEHIAVDHQVFAIAGKPGGPKPPPPPPAQVTPAGVVRIGANTVWGEVTGSGVGVAIVDTGLDFAHADLPINKGTGNAFSAYGAPQDQNGHGTHVGGIVAALNNSIDVVGVAPGAVLYAVKVLDATGSGWDADIVAGLNWVAENAAFVSPPIRVVNMSLGRLASGDDSFMRVAVQGLVNAGITVVVAAGNDASKEVSQMVPAGFPEVIAVASTTATAGTSKKNSPLIPADTASYFTTDGRYNSTTGVGVCISAPGAEAENNVFPFIESVGILSTALGGGTTRLSGTSMAAPHVAGVAALIIQNLGPIGPFAIKTRIMSGDRKGTAPLNSIASSYTFDGEREGILNAPLALAP